MGAEFTAKIWKWLQRHPPIAVLAWIPPILWFLSTCVNKNIHEVWLCLMSHAMASVTISKNDRPLYNNVKGWILTNAVFRTRRALAAQSSEYAARCGVNIGDGESLVFEGHSSIQFFRRGTQCFVYTEEDKGFKIWCFGYSPKPIQDFLYDVENEYQEVEVQQVSINSAYLPEGVRGASWTHRASTLRRSLESVCLDSDVKEMLIDDISDYLDPDTALWYAERGLAHRRGYLLYGRPGCGKTSFAMAVAAHFDLSIYTVSLLDKNLTDTKLLQLFRRLKSGCLVLLEDIDCAGRGRELQVPAVRKSQGQQPSTADATNAAAGGVNPKKREPEPPSQVTLSGLLNAIDGVSAPQGHLLIMTTYHPELLDPALIRPGRIDVPVEFEFASTEQIRSIFINMYTPYSPDKPVRFDPTSVPALADDFANIVPVATFSPAEIQQHLLMYRVRPDMAVAHAFEMVERKRRNNFQAPKPESKMDTNAWKVVERKKSEAKVTTSSSNTNSQRENKLKLKPVSPSSLESRRIDTTI